MIPCDICGKEYDNLGITNHRLWHDLPENRRKQERLKRKISENRKGKLTGRDNAQYGKFGIKHSTHGHNRLLNSKNGKWKGDDVGYPGVHGYVKRRLLKPDHCPDCGEQKKLELSNISGEYKRNLDGWEWICHKCHMQKDARRRAIIRGERNERNTNNRK